MSIRTRLTITLTLLGVLLFGGYSLLDYRSELKDLHDSAEAELRYVGRALQVSLGNAIRDHQPKDIDETLTALEKTAPTVDLFVYDALGRAQSKSEGALADPEIGAAARQVATTHTEMFVFGERTESRAIYGAPLTADDGKYIGAVVVGRPLRDLEENISHRRDRMISVVLVFGALMSATGMLLGTAYITRPLGEMLDGVRHVRDGDFKSRLNVARPDEIGALVHEFNAMVTALDHALRQAEEANEARVRVERSLQRIDKMITIGQLSAGLAHEIGSPLQVLRGRASAVLEKSPDPEARRHAEILVEQCDRIARIVEQLLSFGRRKPAVITECKLDAPVNTVVELLAGEARRAGVKIDVDGDATPHVVDADADQMQQVVLNLLKNALAATPRGGTIQIRIETLSSNDGPRSVRLTVRDSGPGIAPEMRDRLFEPFFTTRVSEGGTGLGLAVVRAIALEHGGSVSVLSRPGEGAAFSLDLPPRREASGGGHV